MQAKKKKSLLKITNIKRVCHFGREKAIEYMLKVLWQAFCRNIHETLEYFVNLFANDCSSKLKHELLNIKLYEQERKYRGNIR